MESQRTRPLLYLDDLLSGDKTKLLPINARASVWPETAEDSTEEFPGKGRGSFASGERTIWT